MRTEAEELGSQLLHRRTPKDFFKNNKAPISLVVIYTLKNFKVRRGTSLVIQGLRIHLPV